jgi:hypothetical protein
MSILNAWLEYK